MPEKRSLDPRFDPRYQRGFDPATMPVEPATLRAPVEEATPVAPASAVPAARMHERDEPHPPEYADTDADDELEPVSTRNPYRLALLLVSVGFLVVAAALLWWSANNQNAFLYGSAAETGWNWMIQSVIQNVPAAATVAGFIGIGAWLALGALATLRAEPQPHPEHADEE